MQPKLKEASEQIKALDELFEASSAYRTSKDFLELLKFINRFPTLSPFNAFLIHMQNRGVELVLPIRRWKEYGRRVKNGARPLIILKPFGPVEFVYDIADTEGEPVPPLVLNPFYTGGIVPEMVFMSTIKNCDFDQIIYKEEPMHKASAGMAAPPLSGFYKVVVNQSYDISTKYSTLVHELGHIYAGHVGATKNSWWKPRQTDNKALMEIEAESIAYLVCNRIGLQTTSESYLSDYISSKKDLPSISLDVILTVANHIEQLGRPGFKPKKK